MLITLAAVAIAPLPAPLAEAMEPADPVTVANYRVEMDDGETAWTAMIDPGKPEGTRIAVLAPPQAEWPKGAGKELEAYDSNVDGDIWCDSMDEMVGRDIQEVGSTADTKTYRFKPLIPDDAEKADRAFAKAAAGEITIHRPDTRWVVKGMKLWIDEPFKPVFIAKVTEFRLTIDCAATAEGRMYQAHTTSQVKGSSMGRKFDQVESISISSVVTAR